jgi:hypothetical protein
MTSRVPSDLERSGFGESEGRNAEAGTALRGGRGNYWQLYFIRGIAKPPESKGAA